MGDSEDTDCLESWEDLDDSGVLDKRIEKMQISKTPLQNGISSSNSKLGTVIILSDDTRSRYVPPEPSVKILRRPTVNGCEGNTNSETKPKQPIKSLQQREMEYAEARLRILGEAQSPEEMAILEDRIPKIQLKTPAPLVRGEPPICGIIRLPKGPDGSSGFNVRR